jgi:hypothetical protein
MSNFLIEVIVYFYNILVVIFGFIWISIYFNQWKLFPKNNFWGILIASSIPGIISSSLHLYITSHAIFNITPQKSVFFKNAYYLSLFLDFLGIVLFTKGMLLIAKHIRIKETIPRMPSYPLKLHDES